MAMPLPSSITRFRFAAVLALAVGACSPPTPAAPVPLLGAFSDDYGNHFIISATEWVQQPKSRYHIVRWDVPGQYLIARNDSLNPSAPGLWTRIDWVELPGMAPWLWGFCLSAFDAPTADSAAATTIARRETPKTGCNGYPFSRMRRDSSAH